MHSPGHQVILMLRYIHMQGDEAFAAKLFTYATSQINYMLGDGGQSYVIGFGKDSPTTPFHKWCVAQSFQCESISANCCTLSTSDAWSEQIHLACRSFNSYIDYRTRGEEYQAQHDDFHNTDRPNTFLAYGALVGGPGAEDK